MASPHLPQWPPSSSLPPASSPTSLTTNGCVHPCLGTHILPTDRRIKATGLGWKPVGSWGLLSGWVGWEDWRTVGETESYHLPGLTRKQTENPGPSS